MQILGWLQATTLGTAVRESMWLYPFFEFVHLVGLSLLVGSIAMLDLRLLGFSRALPVTLTARHLLPWTWVGFALVTISGLSLFAAYAEDYFANTAFRWKLLIIAAAGVNATLFHWRVYRGVDAWNQSAPSPAAVRVMAVMSIVLWISTVGAGRMIAYT